jgi:hypothetical protein
VRIVDIRETVVPIKSQIRNAFIDFSQTTVSVLALITDVSVMASPSLDSDLIRMDLESGSKPQMICCSS